jgi:hypothetical protein
MKRLWLRWVAFLNAPEAPDALAAVRVTFGLAVCLNLLQQMLLDDPVRLYAEIEHGGMFGFRFNAYPYTLYRLVPLTAFWAWALLCAQLLAAVCFTLGLFTRAASVAMMVLQMTFYDRLVMFRYDGDNVYRVACYLMALSPAGAAWSLDAAWRGKGRETIARWARWLIMAQVVIIYVRTGLVKLGSSWSIMDHWRALYLALNLPGIARWPGDWAAYWPIYPITQLSTFLVSWWEFLFFLLPLNLWWRNHRAPGNPLTRLLARWNLRPWMLAFGVAMHAGIFVMTDVGLFSVVMVSLYAAWLTPQEARAVFSAALAAVRRPAAGSTA